MAALYVIENQFWQIGILPTTGASMAFGKIRANGVWTDILRPTAEADFDNPSRCSSFLMLPWANRIRGGRFIFEGQEYHLKTTPDDGTARHGDVRKRTWEVEEVHHDMIRLSFDSTAHLQVNFPFAFSAEIQYMVEEQDFSVTVELWNEDTQAMPAGFGHHPYFVFPNGDNTPHLQIPCTTYFDLPPDSMPIDAPKPIPPALDYRTLRPLTRDPIDALLNGRIANTPLRLRYPAWQTEIAMHYDEAFRHVLLFVPPNEDTVAIEPMTIATDGFNLATYGIAEHGMTILPPGEKLSATMRWQIVNIEE
jgi:aldose 1-epimerase